MTRSPSLPARKRIVSVETHPFRGHSLARISERLPGKEPTNATIDLTDGPTYEERYWRCLTCGQERDRRSEFADRCAVPTIATDGGYSILDDRTTQGLSEAMVIERGNSAYSVRGESGMTHRVDLARQTCTCSDSHDQRPFCKHLRHVDIEVRTGTLPDIDAS